MKHPGLPDDYVSFLEDVGWGDVADGRYMFYSSLVGPDTFGWEGEALQQILFFGDDFAGQHGGFFTATNPWVVVTVDSANPNDMTSLNYHLDKRHSFTQFVEKLLTE
jgi:hypothetical protein